MPPTGRSIDLDRIREKLEKAKTVEEKELIVKMLLSYVKYLRDVRRGLVTSLRSYIYALYVTTPLTVASLIVTALTRVPLSEFILVLKYLAMLMVVINVSLTVAIYREERKVVMIEEEIREIYDIMFDPVMRRNSRRIPLEGYLIIAIALTIVTIICAVLTWLI